MSSEHAPEPDRAPCAAHGLFYDPRLAEGCVLCSRERARATAAVRGGGRSLALLLGAFGMVLVALAVGAIRSGALAPWLGGGGAQAAVLSSDGKSSRAAHHAHDRGRPLRVLFVGNSLTSTNDLPGMVGQLAQAASPLRPFEPHAVTFDGFRLRDHIAANGVATLLASGGSWDAVVLQEQGQRPGWPQSREQDFFASARELDQAVRRVGAHTVLYATMARRDGDCGNFPGDDYDAMQRRIDEGYDQLAGELHAELVPVGRAWRAMLVSRPKLALWQDDGQRPSPAGTYLAACAFYAAFYQQSPIGNAYLAGLLPADARAIQEVAAQALLAAAANEATLAQLEPTRAANGPALRTGAGTGTAAAAARRADRPPPATAQRETPEREAEQDRERHERIAAELQAREAAQERDRLARMEANVQAQEQRSGRRRVPVTMYSTSWCGVCKRARAYMQREGIAVRELDVERDSDARAKYRRLNPGGGVPTIDVDGAVLVGWSEQRFEAMLAEAATHPPH